MWGDEPAGGWTLGEGVSCAPRVGLHSSWCRVGPGVAPQTWHLLCPPSILGGSEGVGCFKKQGARVSGSEQSDKDWRVLTGSAWGLGRPWGAGLPVAMDAPQASCPQAPGGTQLWLWVTGRPQPQPQPLLSCDSGLKASWPWTERPPPALAEPGLGAVACAHLGGVGVSVPGSEGGSSAVGAPVLPAPRRLGPLLTLRWEPLWSATEASPLPHCPHGRVRGLPGAGAAGVFIQVDGQRQPSMRGGKGARILVWPTVWCGCACACPTLFRLDLEVSLWQVFYPRGRRASSNSNPLKFQEPDLPGHGVPVVNALSSGPALAQTKARSPQEPARWGTCPSWATLF